MKYILQWMDHLSPYWNFKIITLTGSGTLFKAHRKFSRKKRCVSALKPNQVSRNSYPYTTINIHEANTILFYFYMNDRGIS
jgi:hypothetical protein